MDNQFSMYLAGGLMMGIFAGGVLIGIKERKGEHLIKSIDTASASACNVAYFLAGQEMLGKSIYTHDLQGGFITSENIVPGIKKRLARRIGFNVNDNEMPNAVDINYLINFFRNGKKLDVEALRRNPISAHVKVFDTIKQEFVYLDIKEDPFKVMHDAISVIPYYFPPISQEFIDGGVLQHIGYDELRRRHPQDRIVVCLNYDPDTADFATKVKNTLEGIVASWMYPHKDMIGRFFRKVDFLHEDVEKIKRDPNALLIHPPESNPTTQRTTDPEKLETTYQMGYAKAEEILEWAA